MLNIYICKRIFTKLFDIYNITWFYEHLDEVDRELYPIL